MRKVIKWIGFTTGLALAGCATTSHPPVSHLKEPAPPVVAAVPAERPPVIVSTATAKTWILYIPQTENAAVSSLKLFDRYPTWKMVLAVAPRFHRLIQEPAIKAKIDLLQQQNRLE